MDSSIKSPKSWVLQSLIWIMVLTIVFLSNLQYENAIKALAFAVLAIAFYASVIYTNVYWLFRTFYDRRKFGAYAFAVVCLLICTAWIRSVCAGLIAAYFSNTQFAWPELSHYIFSGFVAIWIYLFSVLYRFALNFFMLSKKQEQITLEKTRAELNGLKQQLQPHFLFNTLNNIYYVTQKASPEAADLIERLAGLIRYFMEDAIHEKVYLKDEVELIRSYIELETIRLRYEMPVDFTVTGGMDAVQVPPLILLPLVENIFKHGVDKRSKKNFAKIDLQIGDRYLEFSTQNKCVDAQSSFGTGLANLSKRLNLYYGDDRRLSVHVENDIFIAYLQIPLYDN